MTAVMRAVVAVALGVILVGATQGVTGQGDGVHTIQLVLEHSRYLAADGGSLDGLEVPSGQRVRFVVHNRDPITHELIAGDLATQQGHETGTDRHHDGAHGAVTVGPGATAETTHVFTDVGSQWIGCHLPGHWDHGMRLPVEVTR